MADEVNPGPPPELGGNPPPVQPTPPPQNMGWSQPPAPGQYYPGQPQQEGVFDSIIPTSNPPSLVSYYCGVFSLTVCFSPILAPISYVAAAKALRRIKEQPGLKGRGHAITGIVTSSIGLFIFVVGIALIILSSRHSADYP